MEKSIETIAAAVTERLQGRVHSIWLYGSVVLGDFRPGWSDIDWLVLTKEPLTEEEAGSLLDLRQELSLREPGNPYFRCFEGIITSLGEFETRRFRRLVYWGTSGQRVTDRCSPDPFARLELATVGRALRGEEDRSLFPRPERRELTAAVRNHYETIRTCARVTDGRLYSCGWLLDIARCLYTLRTGDVIAKTQAGHWALENRLFPADTEEDLRRTLAVRENPLLYRDRADVGLWLCGLGPTVQRCADVLQEALAALETEGAGG